MAAAAQKEPKGLINRLISGKPSLYEVFKTSIENQSIRGRYARKHYYKLRSKIFVVQKSVKNRRFPSHDMGASLFVCWIRVAQAFIWRKWGTVAAACGQFALVLNGRTA